MPLVPLTNGSLVYISTLTSNAIIRYTLDGSDPNTNSAVYSNSLLLTNPMKLTARAFRSDLAPSDAQSGYFGLLDFENTVVTTLAGATTGGFTNGDVPGIVEKAVGGLAAEQTGSAVKSTNQKHQPHEDKEHQSAGASQRQIR